MKILFCDWNGTLLNDTPIWDEARKKVFLAFGVEPPTVADHFREMESDYLTVYRNRGITASREELNAVYERAYKKRLPDVTLFPRIPETLERLRAKKICLVLLTAQLESLVVPLLKKFRIRYLFNDCAFHAFDKQAVIIKIARRYHVKLDHCAMVGDSPFDIRHAKKAGITAIALVNDYVPADLLAGADHYLHSFEEITDLF